MPERDVCSSVNSRLLPKTFGPGSNQPYSPGAFSNPSRRDGGRQDSAPPRHVRASRNAVAPTLSEAFRESLLESAVLNLP
jgi:hypothetical protein